MQVKGLKILHKNLKLNKEQCVFGKKNKEIPDRIFSMHNRRKY